MSPNSPNIRWRLIFFAIGCMAVAVSVAGAVLFLQARRELSLTEAQVQRAVHDAEQHAEQQLNVATAILSALSTSPALQHDDFVGFYHQASAVRGAPGSWCVLFRPVYQSRADQLVNTGRPLGAPPQTGPATDAAKDFVKRVVATRDVQISDLVYSPTTKEYVVGVGMPILRDGEVVYVLALVLGHVMAKPELEVSSIGFYGVVDRAGQLLPGHNLPDQTTTRPPFDPALLKARGTEGVLDGAAADDGRPLYIAYSRSELTGWTVFYGIPKAALDAPFERALMIVGIGFVLLPMAGAGIASVAGPGVVLPLQRRIEEDDERLRVIADTVPSMLFTADQHGACDYISERFYEYTGLPVGAAQGFGWMQVVHPEDRDKILERMRDPIERETPEDVELRLRGKRGVYRWFAIRMSHIKGADGKLFGTATDVEVLKRTERALSELSSQLMKAQDDERRRIARELHDTTVQDLVAAKIQIEQVHESLASLGAPTAMALDTEKLLEKSLSDLRTLSYLLHPPMLDELGLAAAVRWYVRGFQKRSGIAISVETPVLPRLREDIEMALFRVVQEGLANVHRHSGSPEASIRFMYHTDRVELEIADKGRGNSNPIAFPANHSLGVGIPGMRLRVQQLGGTLEFKSAGGGSTLRVAIPIVTASVETSPASAGPDEIRLSSG